MEQLNKQQLILLALLVSFVTSIATGIVTASLMEQAPKGVTQTINRVVEKTIERVVTEPSKQTATVVSKETVVVKADDVTVEAIEKNIESVVRIREVLPEGRLNFAGLALVISSEGILAADLAIAYQRVDATGNTIAETYQGLFPDGRIFPLNIAYADQNRGVIFFQVLLQDKEKGVYRFTVPAYGTRELKLGQSVIALSGDEQNAVSTGIISSLNQRPAKDIESVKETVSIRTDIRSSELVSGSVLLNLSGEVIGLNAGTQSGSRNMFVPIQKVLEFLPKALPPAPAS